MSIPTNAQFMTALQWLSPAFPIGGFAYSHGLEWAITEERIYDADTVREWLLDLLKFGSARTDAILVALAANDQMPLAELNARALALCPSRERMDETQLQGAAFATLMRDVWAMEFDDFCLPVAIGGAARTQSIPAHVIVAAFVHAFCANLISVAVRLVPIGQTQGQKVLLALYPEIDALTQSALTATQEDLTSCTFLSDGASMLHETQSPRIFKT